MIKHGWNILISHSQDKLPIEYTATIDRAKGSWTGTAKIPIDYFPPGVQKINAYAIHGSGINRRYESLYPASADAENPDLWVALKPFHVTLLSKLVTLITVFKIHSDPLLSCSMIIELRLFAILELLWKIQNILYGIRAGLQRYLFKQFHRILHEVAISITRIRLNQLDLNMSTQIFARIFFCVFTILGIIIDQPSGL